MRIARISACAVALFCLALAPAYAQRGKGGGAAAPHGNPHTTTAAKAPTLTTHGSPATTQGPKTTTHAPTTHGGPKSTTATTTTTKTQATLQDRHGVRYCDWRNDHASDNDVRDDRNCRRHGNDRNWDGNGRHNDRDATESDCSEAPRQAAWRPHRENAAGQHDPQRASSGFRNQGQFIAAVHVSQNLGIPFADLRATMLGLPLPGNDHSHDPPPQPH